MVYLFFWVWGGWKSYFVKLFFSGYMFMIYLLNVDGFYEDMIVNVME